MVDGYAEYTEIQPLRAFFDQLAKCSIIHYNCACGYSTVLPLKQICFLMIKATVSQTDIFVRAADTPDCNGKQPCRNLPQHLSKPQCYFTSNATINFLPGMHLLEEKSQ